MKATTMPPLPKDIKIYDCGNIKLEEADKASEVLRELVAIILQYSTNSTILVLGGTDDLNLHVIKGAATVLDGIDMIKIDSALNIEPAYTK